MTLVIHPGATPAVQRCVLAIQTMISRPAIDYPPTGQGSARRRIRELAKMKANKAADAARAKAATKTAKAGDVVFDELPYAEGMAPIWSVEVFGQRVGTVKQLGDKFVLFSMAADEISSRARLRDVKGAAAKLYKGSPEPKQSRQVRRRLERKGW